MLRHLNGGMHRRWWENPYDSGNENMRRRRHRIKEEIRDRKRNNPWRMPPQPFRFAQHPGVSFRRMASPPFHGMRPNPFTGMMPHRLPFSPMNIGYKRRFSPFRSPMSPPGRGSPTHPWGNLWGMRGPCQSPRRGYPPPLHRRAPIWQEDDEEDEDNFSYAMPYCSDSPEDGFGNRFPRYRTAPYAPTPDGEDYDLDEDWWEAEYDDDDFESLSSEMTGYSSGMSSGMSSGLSDTSYYGYGSRGNPWGTNFY